MLLQRIMRNQAQNHNIENDHNIVIVNNHQVARLGLIRLINQNKGLKICAEATQLTQALYVIAKTCPDLVIVSIALESSKNIELIRSITQLYPDLPVLAISMHDEPFCVESALEAGANGYITKREAPEKIAIAIRKILDGQIYISDTIVAGILQNWSSQKNLKKYLAFY